jgi:hypothetical protein
MAKKEIFIERRPQGDYAIRRPGSDRASGVNDVHGMNTTLAGDNLEIRFGCLFPNSSGRQRNPDSGSIG